MRNLKDQIVSSVSLYTDKVQPEIKSILARSALPEHKIVEINRVVAAAFFSGISLTSSFLQANDGQASAAEIGKAVSEVAKVFGLDYTPLKGE